MEPEELSTASAGMIGRRLARSLERQSQIESPAAWEIKRRPEAYPIPVPEDWEPPTTRDFYGVELVPTVSQYRDRCDGLDAEILRDQAFGGRLEIETAVKEESLGVASQWTDSVSSWCRGDVTVTMSPETTSSDGAVEFKSTFRVDASSEEQMIEVGYAVQIDATYRAVAGNASKGSAGVTVRAGVVGNPLSKVGGLSKAYRVEASDAPRVSNKLDLEGEAVVVVPASTSESTICLTIVVSHFSVGLCHAEVTSMPRAGIVVFRPISSVKYERRPFKETYEWPPPGITWPPRGARPPWPLPF